MVSEVRTLAPSSLQAIRRTRPPPPLFCTTVPCDTRNQRCLCESSLALEANLVLHLNPTNSFIRFILAFLGVGVLWGCVFPRGGYRSASAVVPQEPRTRFLETGLISI